MAEMYTNYQEVPWYRRSGTRTAFILGGFSCVPPLLWAACAICLTGDVYYNRVKKDGTLARWAAGNQVAAVIILALQSLGIAIQLGAFGPPPALPELPELSLWNKKAPGQKPGEVGAPREQEPTGPVVVSTDALLHEAYGKNIIAADRKYTGKKVEVELVRGIIKKDKLGRYYIHTPIVANPAASGDPGVKCYIRGKSASMDRLAEVLPGQAFHLRGSCLGRKDEPMAQDGYTVTLGDCDLIRVLEFRDGKWQEVAK